MNEQQRLDYLRPMGYQVYYPRFVVPGAKASPRYQLPASPPPSVSPATTARSGQVSRPARRSAPGPDNTLVPAARPRGTTGKPRPAPTGKPAAVNPARPVTSPPATRQELRFHLQYFAINRQLAVISETPHQLQAMPNRDSADLLSAILQALMPAPMDTGGDRNKVGFDWPLAEGLRVDNPRRAAALALQGFINQHQQQDGFADLLLFSSQLPRILTGDDQAEATGERSIDGFQCRLVFTHDLHSMLAHPLLKREVWSHLQGLCSRLRATGDRAPA